MTTVLTTARSQTVDAGGTSATRFPDTPCRLVVIRAKSGNAGVIQICGVNGSTVDTAGIPLAAGEFMPTVTLSNLNQLGYIAATGTDDLDVLVIR